MNQPNRSSVAELDFAISGMTCAACAARVEKKLNKVPGVTAAVNLATEKAHLQLEEEAASITVKELVSVVEKAGYGATLLSHKQFDSEDVVRAATTTPSTVRAHNLWFRFWVALALSVPVVAVSMIEGLQYPGWQWASAVAASIVAFYCGWPFHHAALRAARYASSTMDTLVSLGVIASMGWSLWALFFGGAGHIGYVMSMSGFHSAAMPHLYFESAAMIVTFLLLGRWLEARSRHTAGEALRSLLDLAAHTAHLLQESPQSGSEIELVEVDIPVQRLHVGDLFCVKPGEKIPTDGIVVSGNSAVNAALLTGESLPVDVSEGSAVTGATLNTYGSLYVRATRVGEHTTLAHMGRLLAEAQIGKAKVQRLADKVSSVFVPSVLVIAGLDIALRLFAGNSLEMALVSAITVLVVACPCALGLATPTALLVGSGAASKRGIFIKGPEVLERAHSATRALFDKTGTLTDGRMSVVGIIPITDANGVACASDLGILQLAAILEKHSEHPIAAAIVARAQQQAQEQQSNESSAEQPKMGGDVLSKLAGVQDFRAIPGKGVRGVVCNQHVWVGSLAWLQELDSAAVNSEAANTNTEHPNVLSTAEHIAQKVAAQGATPVAVARDSHILGVIAVADTLRSQSWQAIEELKKLGIVPLILSGDVEASVQTVAAKLEIEARAGLLPEEKVAAVAQFQQRGDVVVMVGDGVNDAAALARADLSIAMGAGSDVAKSAADITIMNSDPQLIPAAIRISKRTLRIIKQNLAWAFSYNLIAIPLALAGIIAPGLAAAAMASSSVIVVVNSLRLRNMHTLT